MRSYKTKTNKKLTSHTINTLGHKKSGEKYKMTIVINKTSKFKRIILKREEEIIKQAFPWECYW